MEINLVVGAINWIHLAQNGDKWPALMNTVTTVWVPQMPGIS